MSPKRRTFLSLVFACICISKSLLIIHYLGNYLCLQFFTITYNASITYTTNTSYNTNYTFNTYITYSTYFTTGITYDTIVTYTTTTNTTNSTDILLTQLIIQVLLYILL